MADKIWDILTFLKNPDADGGQQELSSHSENEKKGINDQLMATLENTERMIDAAMENEDIQAAAHDAVQQSAPSIDPPAAETQPAPAVSKAEQEQPAEVANTDKKAETNAAAEKAPAAAEEQPAQPKAEHDDSKGSTLQNISVARVRPNPFQPRKIMGENEITELSQSIRELGVLQPILVRQSGDAYELIAGERRLRAAQRAGLSEIPAMVVETQPLAQQIIALVENIQRKNLSAIEEAVCLQDIIAKTGWSQTELSRRTGRSQASIANKLRLLRLDRSVQDLILSGKLGERHARSLLSLSVDEQKKLAQKAIDEDLSASALEALAESWNDDDKQPKRTGKQSKNKPDGPAGDLLTDIAAIINKHRSRGTAAQWKVKHMNNASMLVEISVDLSNQNDPASDTEKAASEN